MLFGHFIILLSCGFSLSPTVESAADNRTEVALLNLCTQDSPPWARHQLSLVAFESIINARVDMFPGFKLKIYYQCAIDEDTGSATKAFIDGYFKPPAKAAIIGMAYSPQSQVVAAVARFYGVPVLSYSNASPLLSDKSLYPTYSRLQLTHSLYNPAILKILRKYNWYRIGLLITEADQIYPVGVQFDAAFAKENGTSAYKALFKTSTRDGLMRMKADDIRIFVVFSYSSLELEPLQCIIHELQLYGPKYQWIYSGWHSLPIGKPSDACLPDSQVLATQNAVIFDAAITDPSYRPPQSVTGQTIDDLYVAHLSTFPDKTPLNSTLMRTFDTLTTMALAINDTLAADSYSEDTLMENSTFKLRLLNNIRRQDFVGVEGPVKFDANGDRTGQVIIYQILDNVAVPTATFDPSTSETVWKRGLKFQGEKPPIDRTVVVEQLLSIDRSAATACRALSAVGIGLAVASMGINFRFRHLKLIKLSSPNVNLLIALGCTLGYVSCILMSLDSLTGRYRIAQCWSVAFCLALGYSCAFGAMFAKTWRVHVIFTNKKLKRVAIKDWHLMSVVVVLALLDLAILVTWILTDPLELKTLGMGSQEDLNMGIVYKSWLVSCQCAQASMWSGILLGIKGIVLIFGIFFAWETRQVHFQALNDSKQIGICVYNTMIMGSLAVCLSFVLPASAATLNFVLVTGCIFICSTATLLLVFGSKIVSLIQFGPARVDDIANVGAESASVMSDAASAAAQSLGWQSRPAAFVTESSRR